MQSKSIDWFLYDDNFASEKVVFEAQFEIFFYLMGKSCTVLITFNLLYVKPLILPQKLWRHDEY